MALMNTDEPGMAAAAARYDQNAAQLKALLAREVSITEELKAACVGQTGTAIQVTGTNYEQSQLPLISQVDTIGQHIRAGGLQYGSGDSDGMSFVQTAGSGFHV